MDERSRLAEFRQMKGRIRESGDYLVVGIDVAKERHNAFLGTSGGRTLKRGLVFDNTREGFEKLLFHAQVLGRQKMLENTVFGMEPTADYHKPLGEYLIRNGHMTVLVSGNAVKNNRELIDGRWDKHDTKDAANVADLISQGKCLFYELPSPQIRQIRSLLSLRRRLRKNEQAYRVRIRNHLIAQYFPEFDPYYGYGEGPRIVRDLLDPGKIASLAPAGLISLVGSRNGGERQMMRLREIHGKAGSSIGCTPDGSVAFEAGMLSEGLRAIQAMIDDTDKKIEEVAKDLPEYPCLMSIPGFGPVVSSMVIGAIGDPHRFENGRQVLKTAGYDLSADRTGKRTDSVPVISKRGKADLRYALYQAAFSASLRNGHFIRYYTAKIEGRQRERGIATKMRVKLAAKMLVIAWALMKKREVFDPGYLTV